jgi:membrane-bound metal-dependent hydrolase YbcI (DUF457 family)
VDPVTHTLVGVGLGNALFRRRVGAASVPILALASNLPDIDAVVHLTGNPAAVLMRRTFGHSLFLVPLWSLVLAWLLRRRYRQLSLRALFGMVLLGAGVHLFFDLINSFGVVLLWPLSPARPELAWVFIVDFVLTGLLALPLILGAARRLRPRIVPLSRAALLAVAAYLVFCGWSRAEAGRLLARADGETHPPGAVGAAVPLSSAVPSSSDGAPDFTYVFPEPLGPHRWRGVVRRGAGWDIYLLHPLSGRAELRRTVRSDLEDPRVQAARATAFGRRLDRFFKAPVWQVDRTGAPDNSPGAVVVWDLRFTTLVLDRPPAFQFSVPVPPSGPDARPGGGDGRGGGGSAGGGVSEMRSAGFEPGCPRLRP